MVLGNRIKSRRPGQKTTAQPCATGLAGREREFVIFNDSSAPGRSAGVPQIRASATDGIRIWSSSAGPVRSVDHRALDQRQASVATTMSRSRGVNGRWPPSRLVVTNKNRVWTMGRRSNTRGSGGRGTIDYDCAPDARPPRSALRADGSLAAQSAGYDGGETLAARGRSEGCEKSGTANQFASG